MTMDEAQWRQDADGSWQYLAGDGTWCQQDPSHLPPTVASGHDPAPRRNRLGIVGVALGILAGGIGGLVGIYLGVRGRRQVRDSRGDQIGIRWAVASIVVGIASVVATAAILGVVLLQPSQPPSPSAQAVESSVRQSLQRGPFDVTGIATVACAMPTVWVLDQTFVCFAESRSDQELGAVHVKMLLTRAGGWATSLQWSPQ
jgi:MFS family permease